MNSFPFYRSFYNNYYNPNYDYMLKKYKQYNPNTSFNSNHENIINRETSIKLTHNTSKNENYKNQKKEPLFELFGFNLFLDDLIILGLLYFLYNEGVNDEFLYISLILLLLS